ncbi:MAG: glycoside hydrolase family 13 protein [Cuneatibacter sp.]|nr:glycoside hydrolase family 13 protein [Cuneatibacter sp.]
MKTEALFSDETGRYRIPSEPGAYEEVTIRFRTAKGDVSCVYLIHGNAEWKMELAESDDWFDYYQCTIRVENSPYSYYFEVSSGLELLYYDKTGCVSRSEQQHMFRISPGFSTPEWSRGALMYQIFPDRFCNGDPANDILTGEYRYINAPVEHVEDWNSLPQAMDVGRFYGGDLQGVRKKLDYLQSLGVEVLYFNPLFVSPSNHKYDSQDYDYIDPHLTVLPRDEGAVLPPDAADNSKAERYVCRVTSRENLEASNAWFIDFVKEIHSRGMRIILDGVFNHCGSFHKWMDREKIYEKGEGYAPGAYASEKSPYHGYFRFAKDTEKDWPDNGSYEGWWGHDTLPKLNYEGDPGLYEEILRIGRKWVSPPYCVDGWRLDVAADLGHSLDMNHQFWKDFRKAVKEVNPDALILAEHYGDPSAWLRGGEWDSVMNYDAFMEPVTWFLTGMEKHSDERNDGLYGNGEWFFRAMAENMSKFCPSSLYSAMNELSNHDHSRFLTRTNRTVGRVATAGAAAADQGISKGVFREAVVMQMTWPGAPTIYYGDEAGMTGWTDPDNRRTYPWGREDLELIEFHKYMAGFRRRIPALRTGSIKKLNAGIHLACYGRFQEDSQAVIVINNSPEPRTIQIPVWQIGVTGDAMRQVLATSEQGYNVGSVERTVRDGMMEVTVGPVSAAMYANVKKED